MLNSFLRKPKTVAGYTQNLLWIEYAVLVIKRTLRNYLSSMILRDKFRYSTILEEIWPNACKNCNIKLNSRCALLHLNNFDEYFYVYGHLINSTRDLVLL